jgi:hypothetical protein
MRAERYGTENADNVRAMAQFVPANGTIRLNVSGDFMADNDGTPDAEYIAACNDVAAARPDVTIIAYTHAWRTLTPATFAFTVNASCDNETDIADAIAAGWPTVVVEPGDRFTGRMFAGRRTVTCPNATTGVQCVDCKLCARPSRATVAFPVHGARKGAAGRAITAR